MNTQNTTPDAGDNIKTLIAELKTKMRSLGAVDAKGSSSRPEAALRLVDAAFEGLVDESDAADMFGEYATGVAKAAAMNPLVTSQGNGDQNSSKQQVSKFRQFIKVGMLPQIDARDTMARAVKICKDLDATEARTYSRFDALLNVAREQVKTSDTSLTDEQIIGVVTKAESADKTTLDRIIAAYKAAYKLATDLPTARTEAARDAYRDEIIAMDGDVPPMTKEEKAEHAFMSQAAARGYFQGHLRLAAE